MVLISTPDTKQDVGMHECEELLNVNTLRSLEEMPLAFVFFDYDKLKWVWRDYCERDIYKDVAQCPFCDQKLELVIEIDRFYWLIEKEHCFTTVGQALLYDDKDLCFWICGDEQPIPFMDFDVLGPVQERE